MKKSDRELIFNKFGGRCSYCGTELGNKWHVDHAKAVHRKYDWKGGGWFVKGTSEVYTEEHFEKKIPYEVRKHKLVQTGFHKPENDIMENYMPSCVSCNINKHTLDIEGFRRFIGNFITSLNRDSTQYKIAKRYGLIQETGVQVQFYFETISEHKEEKK